MKKLTDAECRLLLVRALKILNEFAGEGIFMPGFEEPDNFVFGLCEQVGVEDVEELYDAIAQGLPEQERV